MTIISGDVSESLREYLILTGWVKEKPEMISLRTKLGGKVPLQYPYMTARMQSVVGPEMAVAAGRQGILTCIPRSLRDIDKQAIIDANNRARLRQGNIELVSNPERTDPNTRLEDVVNLVGKTGHSVIPVFDRYSKLEGVYVHDPDHPPSVSPNTPIRELVTPIRVPGTEQGIPVSYSDQKEELMKIITEQKLRFVPIIDEKGILHKMAFVQKYDTNFIGMAMSTRIGWEAELEKWGSQVDTLMIDSSNACFEDAAKILRAAKERFPDKPFGIGNIIQGKHFKIFAELGADYIIGGMGVGSICQTGSERGNGRGQFTVARECAAARDKHHEKTGKYVQFVVDGGIGNVKDMTVALAFGDLLMMGNYFNKFYEAAARKFDAGEEPTYTEELIRYVETWGEGHPRARLVAMFGMNFEEALRNPNKEDISRAVERYGHSTLSAATIEGVVGLVSYRGRLKPNVEQDARYIKTTIANSGASDLEEFRSMAVLERASPETIRDMYPHDIKVREGK
jgi:IMP dehydrogenase/GMP reductase